MNSILLAAPPALELAPLRNTLSRYGLECTVLKLSSGLRKLPPEASKSDRAIVVLPQEGVVDIGERVSRLHRLLPHEVPLTVCTYRLISDDRELLREECGAEKVVTPRAWTDSAVAERILAELIQDAAVTPSSFGRFRGGTMPMRRIYEEIDELAPFDEPILILGETGTGKELAAHEIHDRSSRTGELLPVEVPSLTPEMIASELFGHEKGAFTGATSRRQGLLVKAGQGTVFLDEIGDLDSALQTRLLRVLEEHEVRPVGSNRWQKVKARIVLATNRDLVVDCRSGRFRQDLFERIRGFTIRLPALRERRADIPLLVHHFVDEFNRAYKLKLFVPHGALEPLFRYSWPGNVRELRNIVRQAAAVGTKPNGPISVTRLREEVRDRSREPAEERIPHDQVVHFDPSVDSWKDVHDRTQAHYFRSLLKHSRNKSEAAKRAGYGRTQFYEILKHIGETPADRD